LPGASPRTPDIEGGEVGHVDGRGGGLDTVPMPFLKKEEEGRGPSPGEEERKEEERKIPREKERRGVPARAGARGYTPLVACPAIRYAC